MKIKKIIALFLSCLMVLACFAGCSNKDVADAPAANAPAADAPTVDAPAADPSVSGSLTIWQNNYAMEAPLTAVIEGFNAIYPDVIVEYEIMDPETYDTLLGTAIQAGEAPDLFWTNGTATAVMGDAAAAGALLDLTDVVDFSAIVPDSLAISTIDDQIWSVPWLNIDTKTVFYNKDMFAENGWEVPNTFSEYEALLASVKEAEIIPLSVPFDVTFINHNWQTVCTAMYPEYSSTVIRGEEFAISDEATIKSLEKVVEWGNLGYYGDNWTGLTDFNEAILQFVTGKAAMMPCGSWNSSLMIESNPNLNLGAFAVPAEDGSRGIVTSWANGFSVNANSQNPDAALAFINYCASLEGQTAWVQALGAIPATDAIVASTELANEITAGVSNYFTDWLDEVDVVCPEAKVLFRDRLDDACLGDQSVEELLNEMQALADK